MVNNFEYQILGVREMSVLKTNSVRKVTSAIYLKRVVS